MGPTGREDNGMRPLVTLAFLMMAIAPARAGVATGTSSLAWMAGSWGGMKDGVEMEEVWLPPKGGTLMALHRNVREGKTISFELLRIEEAPTGLVYLASPQGRPATPFPAVETGERRIVFENPSHDFPRRILYWLGDDGALHARIEGTIKGEAASEEWSWTRR